MFALTLVEMRTSDNGGETFDGDTRDKPLVRSKQTLEKKIDRDAVDRQKCAVGSLAFAKREDERI